MTHTVLATGLGFPEGPVWLGPRRVAFTQIRGQCISLGDGVLYVTLSGPGELVSLPIDAEPLPLYPAAR